jgi:hypothetical protein
MSRRERLVAAAAGVVALAMLGPLLKLIAGFIRPVEARVYT